jgi:DNA-binding MarR family transcriptional regulator
MHAATHAINANGDAAAMLLWWLGCLPVMEEEQLQAILGVDRWTMTGALRDLGQGGLTGWLVVDSPEFAAPRRVHYLTGAGTSALARMLGCTGSELEQSLPIDRRELLSRITRVETALGIADFIVALAAGLRDEQAACLVEARGSHWARRRQPASVPAVDAHVRLRLWETSAGFGLVWDRAASPAAYRRRRVAAWYRADDAHHRTGQTMPPVLIVCPTERTVDDWTGAVERSAARRARELLPIALATADDVAAQGPLASGWRRPGSDRRLDLLDCLAWRTAPATQGGPPHHGVRWSAAVMERPEAPHANAKRRRSPEQTPFGRQSACRSRPERWATLSIRLSATQKRLLNWVGHHPLLSHTHLAVHLGLTRKGVETLLRDLACRNLIARGTIRRRDGPEDARYLLTAEGAAYLAARDGVPPRLYLTEGVIAADEPPADVSRRPGRGQRMAASVRLTHLQRYWEHTVGVQHFAFALACEARRQRLLGRNHRLLAWLNEAEAQVWFQHAGRLQHIRPDGRFLYQADGVIYDLLLEWDRGRVRHRDYRRKLTAYGAYVAAHVGALDDRHRLLIATTRAAEPRLREVLAQVAAAFPPLSRYVHVVCRQSVADAQIVADLLHSAGDQGTHGIGRTPPWTGNC